VNDAPQPAAAAPVPVPQPAPKPTVTGPKPSQKLGRDPGDASPHGHDAEAFVPVEQVIFASTVVLP